MLNYVIVQLNTDISETVVYSRFVSGIYKNNEIGEKIYNLEK